MDLSVIKFLIMGCPSLTVKSYVQSKLMPLNILVCHTETRPWYYFINLRTKVMINMYSWGYLYSLFSGEMPRSTEENLLQKYLPRIFSLIKNERIGIKDDQIRL